MFLSSINGSTARLIARLPAAAHSSLGRTLRKLNTCLHIIISSLLSCGRNNLKVDYQYLTSVSDVSRQEALEALSQLSYRMSQSTISLRQQKEQEKRTRHRHGDGKPRHKIPSSRSVTDVTERSRQKIPSSKSFIDVTDRSRHPSVSGDKKQPTVRKVYLKSASTPQLAMVRPKTHRRSSSSKSEVSTTAASSPKTSSTTPTIPTKPKHRRALSDQPYAFPPAAAIALAMSETVPPPQKLTVKESATPVAPQTLRRRQDKITPSVYTFQSASTRLGEIPEFKWSLPYDHEAMMRLNNEHGGRPWPPPPEPTKPKRGFFSLFKKSEMKTAEAAA